MGSEEWQVKNCQQYVQLNCSQAVIDSCLSCFSNFNPKIGSKKKKRLLPSEILLKYCLQGDVEKSIEVITENPRILRGQKNVEKQTIAHILVSENNQVSDNN